MKIFLYLSFLFSFTLASAQTNLVTLTTDGAWTWYNDPRALFHNGVLYFGYVRNSDGRSVLSSFNTTNGVKTDLWASALTQKDDHNNPGLLVKQDGTMLAIHARHGTDQFFSYRLSTSTNPSAAANWTAEQTIAPSGAGLTYANPFQLAHEGGKIYDFSRDLNFNPTVFTSTNGGSNWSAPQLFIKNGTGAIRPYVKYASDYTSRIEFLYTDGHPRDITNSLYHLYYQSNAVYKTDGTLVTNFANLPLLHESGQRGSVIYQYSDAPTDDPNDHIPTGRAWCWEVVRPTNSNPVCLFTVQRDQVTGPNWFDDRIYYYYSRWTGTTWQKRFIAQAGRALFSSEDDYAGGICADPENPNIIYISSNAQNPFNLTDTTNVTLNANERYEIYRGVTADGGLTFTWTPVTTNSTKDNLRPYIPRHQSGTPVVLWFRGTYTTFNSYDCEIVGLFPYSLPLPPKTAIVNPSVPVIAITNLSNQLALTATLTDDGLPQPATISWTTTSGPTNAIFSQPSNLATSATFPVAGIYVLTVTVDDTLAPDSASITVIAGPNPSDQADASRVLWLKLNEISGLTAADSAGTNAGTLSGGSTWRPTGGMRGGAIEFDGTSGQIVVPDANSLDGTSAFTLTYWFFANAYPGDSAGLVCKRNNISDNNAYTTYLKAADKHIYVDIDTANNRFSSSALISTGQWYHVALTFDGTLPSTDRAKLWINGTLDVTATESATSISNCTSAFRLGNTHPGAANWFNGRLDDVRFYRRALNQQEIAALATTNQVPNVVTGPAPNATNGIPANLSGSVTDDGNAGPVTVFWNVSSGPGAASFGNSNAATTSVTFTRSGNHTLRLSGSDSQATASADLSILVHANTNVFEDWAALYFGSETNQAIVGPNADGDADTAVNLLEFALGMNPTTNDATPFAPGHTGLPFGKTENISGTNYFLLLVKRPIGRLGISYGAEASGDLSSWTPVSQFGSAVNNGDGTETITYRDLIPTSAAQKRFLRLKVTKL